MKRLIIVLAGCLFLAPLALAGVAQATTPSGTTTTTLGRISLGPYHETSPGFKIFAKDPTDTVVTTTTIAPGGSTGWHSHPGPAFIVVTQGTLTVYDGDDPACAPHTYTQGSGFLDAGLGHVHIARNEGSTTVTVVSIYLNVPTGGSQRIDEPAPVRAENLVRGCDRQRCPACRPAVMITGHVPAVHRPPDHAGALMAAAVPARGSMEDRRDPAPAPPARRPATPAATPPEPGLGRPGTARDPAAVIPKARRPGLRLLVTPDTVPRWHRDIARRRRGARSKRGRTGRPATRRNIKALALRLARDNPGRGYRRIHGELAGLGVKIAAPAAWEIPNKAGMDPAPRRTAPTWRQFLRSPAEAMLACDFFTAELLDGTQAYAWP
jgi:quercetin dioxygenase-like cupin family protein